MNAQGEDVVSGVRTPSTLDRDASCLAGRRLTDLADVCHTLESYYSDMVDVEFTVQDGKLFDPAEPRRASGRPRPPSRSLSTWSTRA